MGSEMCIRDRLHTNLQFTAGGYDEDGYVLAVNCECFYTADKGPLANPPGSLWRVVPADQVPAGAETARTLVSLGDQNSSDQKIRFLHSLDNKPLKLPVDDVSQAVTGFYSTGINPYKDNPKATATGSDLYQQWCQSCHLKDGTGRIGPNLVDNKYNYPRGATDVGLFEIIFGGGRGAMQSFSNRMSPDEILKLMAFIQTLK